MSYCTCKADLTLPPQAEEDQRVMCACGITTIVAGRRELREAGERLRNETFRGMGVRRPSPGFLARGQFVGESRDAMRRRVNLMHGREAEDDGDAPRAAAGRP